MRRPRSEVRTTPTITVFSNASSHSPATVGVDGQGIEQDDKDVLGVVEGVCGVRDATAAKPVAGTRVVLGDRQ